ncbi:MAG: hypothetical protein KC593_19955 [Myxococcales bacterium]|nr:hypothetical protein [Myxococcales bacterium]
MFDRLKDIEKRWDAMPVGPWRVDGADPRWVVRDAHGRALLETADKAVARELAASYEDVAYMIGEVKRARREAKEAREKDDDFLGKAHNGRITLATYTIEPDDSES